jgi:beta-carotene 3-hydroxylase
MLVKILALVGGFTIMEFMAFIVHKYVMHGFLWSLHKSHHQKTRGFFELNDLYFVLFAIPGAVLIMSGVVSGWDWKFFTGLGIALYGLTYLIVHDIIIHQRISFFKTNSEYINALRRAHKAHHANPGKEAGVSYGLLLVSPKYFKTKS